MNSKPRAKFERTLLAGAFTLAVLTTFTSSPSKAQGMADGPRIDHHFERSGRVEIEKITYPKAEPGQKLVVINLPRTDDGRIDLNHFVVKVSFTVNRMSDSCNKTYLQGAVRQESLRDRDDALYYTLTSDSKSLSTTLKSCLNDVRVMRAVEITTDLGVIPFRDNLVFYVPANVDVSAQVWKPAQRIEGVAP